MTRFVGRAADIAELNYLFEQRSVMASVYGRRRVGKTTLLVEWMRRSGRPTLYWVARRDTPGELRQSLARAIYRWAFPQDPNPEPPTFTHWESLFLRFAEMIRTSGQPLVAVFDEFPYAIESDASLTTNLQAAWDHALKLVPITLVLSGSHIGMMVELLEENAPLYGRITAELPIHPLPFAATEDFFPTYSTAERVAVYSILGGIPAYLERFSDSKSLSDNIRDQLFRRTGMFRSEPSVIISELVRETRNYESVLRSISRGNHTPTTIANGAKLEVSNLPPYLRRLTKLRLIERRTPVTVPPDERETTTRSKYHLLDPYLRFYYRFIEPNVEQIEMGLDRTTWERISEQFRAFIGRFTFEEICRQWVLAQARHSRLPFTPEYVGSDWSGEAEVDVVAINWRERQILLGECKWTVDAMGRSIVTGLVEKTPLIVSLKDWTVHYAFFSRAGFTDAAEAEMRQIGAIGVALERLDRDLRGEFVGSSKV